MSLEGRLDAFVAEIEAATWFSRCGAALSVDERNELCLFQAGLGFVGVPIAGLVDWRGAAQVAQRSDWSRDWWEAEASLEAQLKAEGIARHGKAAFFSGLSRVGLAAALLERGPGLAQVADEALVRVAAGAAAQACHQAGLRPRWIAAQSTPSRGNSASSQAGAGRSASSAAGFSCSKRKDQRSDRRLPRRCGNWPA